MESEYEKLASLLFPEISETIEDLEKRFVKRNLDENAMVTRFAPSPTGYMHIGGLYAALISSKFSSQTNGIFYLRIEDTDKKRELLDGVEEIISALREYDIHFAEGPFEGGEKLYGPYKQSERKEIYQICVKELIKKGMAYPCFCTTEMLEETRKIQQERKEDIGYYGKYAVCSRLSLEEIQSYIEEGKEYVIRLKSPGNPLSRIKYEDEVRGIIEMPENIQDIVLLKTDGIPTYHFAHVVDDHFMRTTLIIRGDEWLASYPLHKQLFEVCGFQAPNYLHIAPIMKMDQGSKRKLSKRKDPEAAVSYYKKQGIPKEAVKEYLMTITNSNYEEWREKNPQKNLQEFQLTTAKMSNSGALFDMEKLMNISRNIIASKTVEECYDEIVQWSQLWDNQIYQKAVLSKNNFIKTIELWKFSGGKVRKDIGKWSELSEQYSYLYCDFLTNNCVYEFDAAWKADDILQVLGEYKTDLFLEGTASEWFAKIKDKADLLGYCTKLKEYKENPNLYCGSITDFCNIIRVAVTGKRNSPDLFSILQILGEEEARKRLEKAICYLISL
ncbi:glutamate--tRNA ligase [Anaeromicropila populeti]|nr:glutamate--tRNA ligase [Anaeromicropila populeti]